MSIRIAGCDINQDYEEVNYDGGIGSRILLGPKKITLRLEADEAFPQPTPLKTEVRAWGMEPYTVHVLPTLEEWFIASILPTLPPDMLRRVVADASAKLLNPP